MTPPPPSHNAPLRTALTMATHLGAVGGGIILAAAWLFGCVFAWGGTVAWGYRPELPYREILGGISGITGTIYMFGGWAVFPIGAVVMLLAWIAHGLARGRPAPHWISRGLNLVALGLFLLPMLLLAIELASTGLAIHLVEG